MSILLCKGFSMEKLNVALDRFFDAYPSDANAYALRAGTWKFDFDKKTAAEIRMSIVQDGRPIFCAQTFPDFFDLDILELGCSDGYNTAGLEIMKAKSVTAIEANADAFLKCLILKNTLGLRAKFLLGDFLKYLDTPGLRAGLIYASGVLYHLTDPVRFLLKCGEVSNNLFLWSLYYNDGTIKNHSYECERFMGSAPKTFMGESFTYHKRFYDPPLVADPKYQGGLGGFANWLTLDDIMKALKLAGYKVLRTLPDQNNGIEAMNIFASKA